MGCLLISGSGLIGEPSDLNTPLNNDCYVLSVQMSYQSYPGVATRQRLAGRCRWQRQTEFIQVGSVHQQLGGVPSHPQERIRYSRSEGMCNGNRICFDLIKILNPRWFFSFFWLNLNFATKKILPYFNVKSVSKSISNWTCSHRNSHQYFIIKFIISRPEQIIPMCAWCSVFNITCNPDWLVSEINSHESKITL